MSDLTIETHRDGQTLTFTVRGELDLSSAPQLRDAIANELDAHEGKLVVLTLADLTFLDSSGLGCLVFLHNQAVTRGKTLQLRSVPDGPRRVIELGGLAPLFPA